MNIGISSLYHIGYFFKMNATYDVPLEVMEVFRSPEKSIKGFSYNHIRSILIRKNGEVIYTLQIPKENEDEFHIVDYVCGSIYEYIETLLREMTTTSSYFNIPTIYKIINSTNKLDIKFATLYAVCVQHIVTSFIGFLGMEYRTIIHPEIDTSENAAICINASMIKAVASGVYMDESEPSRDVPFITITYDNSLSSGLGEMNFYALASNPMVITMSFTSPEITQNDIRHIVAGFASSFSKQAYVDSTIPKSLM